MFNFLQSFLSRKWGSFFSSLLLLCMTIFAKGIGFIRSIFVARFLGATVYTDAYLGAFTIMHMCTIWISSALDGGGIPFLVRLRIQKGDEYASLFTGRILAGGLFFALIFATLPIFFSDFLGSLFFPGFSGETRSILSLMMKILWGFGFFRVLSFILESHVFALNYQVIARFGWIVQSCGIVLGLAGFYWFIGGYSWPVGQSLGQGANFLVLLVFCFALSSKEKLRFRGTTVSQDWKIFLKKTVPAGLSSIQTFVYQVVDRYFASSLAVGSISCMNYATVLWGLVLIVNEPLRSLLTRFSSHYAQGNTNLLRCDMEKALRATLWIYCTVMVGYVVLLPDVVSVVFLHGKFGWNDALRTFQGARILAFRAPGVCLQMILGNALLATGASHVASALTAVSLFTNGFLDWLLVDRWGLNGLLFATTTATYVSVACTYVCVRKRIVWSMAPILVHMVKLFFWSLLLIFGGLWVRSQISLPPFLAACVTVGALFVLGYGFYALFRIRSDIPVGWAPEDILRRIGAPLVRHLKRGRQN